MRALRSLCAMAFLAAIVWSCAAGQKADVAKTYNCAGCKDTVTWEYGLGTKNTPPGKKVVRHTCAVCNQTWAGYPASSSACAGCAKEAMKCPTCAMAGK